MTELDAIAISQKDLEAEYCMLNQSSIVYTIELEAIAMAPGTAQPDQAPWLQAIASCMPG
jgi:hypothetical protein